METRSRVEFKDVTNMVRSYSRKGVQNGVCHAFVPHTTAALLANENCDVGLQKDLDDFLRQLAPVTRTIGTTTAIVIPTLKLLSSGFADAAHREWPPSPRHVAGLFLCEFDGPDTVR